MNLKSLSIVAAAVLLFIGGICAGRFLHPSNGATTTDAKIPQGIFITAEQLSGKVPQHWKEGDARVLVVMKPGETVEDLCGKISETKDDTRTHVLIHQLCAILRLDEYSKAFDFIHKAASNQSAIFRFTSIWARRDPRGVWLKVQTLPESERTQYTYLLFRDWADLNENEALSEIGKHPEGEEKRELLRALLESVALKDPLRALELARENPKVETHQVWYLSVLKLSKSEPKKALETAMSAPQKSQWSAIRGLVAGLPKKTDDQIWAGLDSIPSGEFRKMAFSAFISDLSNANLPAAAKLAARELSRDPNLKEGFATFDLVERLAKDDPVNALAWVDRLPSDSKDPRFMDQIFRDWATTDPEQAIQYALSHRNLSGALEQTVSQWYKSDPSHALAWTRENIKTLRNNDAFTIVQYALTENPQKIDELLALLPSDERRLEAIPAAACSLTRQDPEAAKAYLDNLSEGPMKEHFYETYVATIAERNPGEAASLAAQLPNGSHKQKVISRVADQWAKRDSKSAADWILSLNDPTLYTPLPPIVANWARRDAPAAAQWVKGLPQGTHRDRVIVELATAMIDPAPRDAAEWASSIQSKSIRQRTEEAVARQWLQADRDAARAWIEKTSLPAETIQSLLKDHSSK